MDEQLLVPPPAPAMFLVDGFIWISAQRCQVRITRAVSVKVSE